MTLIFVLNCIDVCHTAKAVADRIWLLLPDQFIAMEEAAIVQPCL